MPSTDNWNAGDWEEWEAFGRMEHPFWRDGMTPEEFEIEQRYWARHYNTIEEKINFKTLYEQREGCRKHTGSDWANETLKCAPFWRDGMTQEEFDREGEYYCNNYFNLVETGQYTPLWKQKQASD